MPSQPLNAFLTALLAVIAALPAVKGSCATRTNHTLIPDNDWPFVAVYENDAREVSNLSRAVDFDHNIEIDIYARSQDECRSLHESIVDAVNADKRMGGTCINCWPVGFSTTYGLETTAERFVKVGLYQVKLRRLM